jgi:hypothetical protein
MTYVVTSFDFGGSSTVKIHVVTDDLAVAEAVYARASGLADAANRVCHDPSACKVLVELTDVSSVVARLGNDAIGSDVTLFWGQHALRSNNDPSLEPPV